jgi:type IV secretion system protein VirB8
VVETRVKSVSPVAPNVAMVRFDTRRHDAGGQIGPPRACRWRIRYRYSGADAGRDRFVNPLGFEVLRYRSTPRRCPEADDRAAAATLKIQGRRRRRGPRPARRRVPPAGGAGARALRAIRP